MNQCQNLSKQRAGGVPDSDKSSRSESIVRSKDLFCVHTGVSVINVAMQYSLYSGSRKNYVTVCVLGGGGLTSVTHHIAFLVHISLSLLCGLVYLPRCHTADQLSPVASLLLQYYYMVSGTTAEKRFSTIQRSFASSAATM